MSRYEMRRRAVPMLDAYDSWIDMAMITIYGSSITAGFMGLLWALTR
jgi:hypothetical protein